MSRRLQRMIEYCQELYKQKPDRDRVESYLVYEILNSKNSAGKTKKLAKDFYDKYKSQIEIKKK